RHGGAGAGAPLQGGGLSGQRRRARRPRAGTAGELRAAAGTAGGGAGGARAEEGGRRDRGGGRSPPRGARRRGLTPAGVGGIIAARDRQAVSSRRAALARQGDGGA